MLIYKLSSIVVLLTDFEPSFCQSVLQWRVFLYLIPLRQFFSACSLQTVNIQKGRIIVHKQLNSGTNLIWVATCEETQNRGKWSKGIIFQGLANFYLMVNENICSKGFCLCSLHLLKVNWKILILYRKKKVFSFWLLPQKITNNFFLLFWKANFWNCS